MLRQRMFRVRVAARGDAALFILLIMGLSGCAQSPARTMARVWDDLPKVPWKSAKDEASDEKLADSKRSGKSSTEKEDDKASGKGLTGRYKLAANPSDKPSDIDSEDRSLFNPKKHAAPRDPFLEEELSHEGVAQRDRRKHTSADDEEPEVSHRDRLKAALSDDSRRSKLPGVDLAEHDRLRLRVESLMRRAKYHVDREELPAAQRAVELAHQLAESGGLEFAPDEERPIDLLTVITGRLEAEVVNAEAESIDAEDEVRQAGDMPAITAAPAVDHRDIEGQDSFDPYAASGRTPEKRKKSRVFETSMVVLEEPSFDELEAVDDEPLVSPTAYSRRSDRDENEAVLSPPPRTPHSRAALEEIPEPPVIDGPELSDEQLVPAPFEEADAPLPPAERTKGPRFGPLSADDLQSEIEEEAEEGDTPRPAGLWPRWLPLSLLSLLTAGLCFWLWNRRHALSD